MIQYDESIIQESAKQLYAQAASVIRTWRIIGGLLGFVVGSGVAGSGGEIDAGAATLIASVIACLGVGIGDAIARPKALIFKLQAQQALCQVQIEKNTRHSVDAADNAARELQLRMMAQR